MSVMNAGSLESLIVGILNEAIENLSEEELQFLKLHRELVAEFLLPIVDAQMEFMAEDLDAVDGKKLYWSLALLAFLKEPEVFEVLKELCHMEIEVIDECLGHAFITEALSWMLASTSCARWDLLKEEIEDPELDEFVRGACIDAVAILMLQEEISRDDVLTYFKECFHRILYRGVDDEPLATQLVSVCMEMWPGECLEEIKELYGMGLVDSSFAEIDDLIDSFLAGKEACLKEFALRCSSRHPLYPLVGGRNFLREKMKSDDLEMLSKEADNAYLAAEAILSEEPIRKKSFLESLLEEGRIIFELESSKELEELPLVDQKELNVLHEKIVSSPEEALQEALERVRCFPENPLVHSHLYIIYCALNWKREAVALIKSMVDKFPGHLFGLAEYAKYLLRRGEPGKVMELFDGCPTLYQLYPERKTFTQAEWHLFSHVMALYHIEIENYWEAKNYLEILEMIDPQCEELKEVEEKLKMSAFSKALRKP